MRHCVVIGKMFALYHTIPTFNDSELKKIFDKEKMLEEVYAKHCGKRS